MFNSYQQTYSTMSQNFLQSRPMSQCIQQSQYIIQDNNDNLSQTNKQNYSHHLNKSNLSHYNNPMNKSNRSHVSMTKSNNMMASKSQSIIMGESKARQLMESHQSRISQKSMKKSYNKMGPALKVLTQSDLSENYYEDDHIFSDSSPQHTEHKGQFKGVINSNNAISQSENQGNMIKSKNQSLIGVRNVPNLGLNNTQRQALHNNNMRNVHSHRQGVRNVQKQEQIMFSSQQNSRQSQGYQHEQEQVPIPQFTYIPNQKLQIRHYSPLNRQKLSLSQLISLLPLNRTSLTRVKKLSIINCFLNSLQGIQEFECLQQVNLRKNQLRQVQQLYRIKNKQYVTSMNIVGNDIQHYHLARYRALTQVFTSLQELNDKNYAMMRRKQRGDMKKVIHKSTKLQYELRKTLKKQMTQTDRAIFRMNSLLVSSTDQQQTQRTHKSHQKHYGEISDHRLTQKDDYSYQNQGVHSNRHYNSSVSRRSTSQIKSPTNAVRCVQGSNMNRRRRQIEEIEQVYQVQQSVINPNSYSLGQSSKQKSFCKTFTNPTINRPQLKQVSLGNLQNVPITKSVKCQQKSPSKHMNKNSQQDKENIGRKTNYNNNNRNNNSNQRNEIPLQTVPLSKNLLQIKTEDLSNDESELHGHLHQPTATFAMQKQRQQQCSLQNKQFMFRNKKPASQFSISANTNNSNQNTISNNHSTLKPVKPKNQLIDQQQQIVQEYEIEQDHNQMSLSRISRISEIPTKRLSHNRRSMTSHSLKPQQRSRLYQNYQNTSQQQSFMTGNDFFPNHNNTYMGMSHLTQWRPNQSMDSDCLLKDKKDLLQEEKLVIATAVYMQNLMRKTMLALVVESTKRKNMPKKKVSF